MIRYTYGFGLAPRLRGKLFQGQRWKEREGQRLAQVSECVFVERGHFPDEPLRVIETGLRKIRNCLTALKLPDWEIVSPGFWMTDESDAKKRLRIEGAED
jgi:hypothetical protein